MSPFTDAPNEIFGMADEILVFELKAQIYALDKHQKWTPLTNDIVSVKFMLSRARGSTRIVSVDGGVTVVNSNIVPSMQYRKPSETFVQWFDTQHILYGLNLTSKSDADRFVEEFEIAVGKRPMPADRNEKSRISSVKEPEASQRDYENTFSSNGNFMSQSPRSRSRANSKSTSPSQKFKNDASSSQLQELNIRNQSLVQENSDLKQTVTSQKETISLMQAKIEKLETNIEKLKAAFQQNATNVDAWKQQLHNYQEVNTQLSSKMNELKNLYDKFGDILKQ